jgi:hypothetical protein
MKLCAPPRHSPMLVVWSALALLFGACGVSEIERSVVQDQPATGGKGGAGGKSAAGGRGGAGDGSGGAGGHIVTPGTGGTSEMGRDAGAGGTTTPRDAAAPAPTADGPAAPPLSGVTISIGGTDVPKEKAIVFLHLGHSNMAGRAQGPPEEKPYFYDTDPHLWQYAKGHVWTPAREPLCKDGGTPGFPQGAGPGMAILRTALALAPDAYMISIGKGQSLDFGARCSAFRKGGLFYDSLMGPALELKGQVTFGGLFVMLGYDGRMDQNAQNGGFITCLEGLAADFRAELEEPDLPFIAGDYERGATGTWSPSCCGAPKIITQLAQVPTAIPRAFLIPTDGLPMQDNHHYNMIGHHMWAARAFAGMADKGLLPWVVGPVAPTP